jgi:hypothetical protein
VWCDLITLKNQRKRKCAVSRCGVSDFGFEIQKEKNTADVCEIQKMKRTTKDVAKEKETW